MNWRKWLWLETPAERSLRVREQCAKAARDRLRYHISQLNARRLNEMRYDLTPLGEEVLSGDGDETEYECDYHPHPREDVA